MATLARVRSSPCSPQHGAVQHGSFLGVHHENFAGVILQINFPIRCRGRGAELGAAFQVRAPMDFAGIGRDAGNHFCRGPRRTPRRNFRHKIMACTRHWSRHPCDRHFSMPVRLRRARPLSRHKQDCLWGRRRGPHRRPRRARAPAANDRCGKDSMCPSARVPLPVFGVVPGEAVAADDDQFLASRCA